MKKYDIDDDTYLSLRYESKSPCAISLIDHIIKELKGMGIKSHNTNLIKAISCFIVAFLKAKRKKLGGYIYREMSAGTFTGKEIGYRPMKKVADGLVSLSYAKKIDAYRAMIQNPNIPSMATRFKPNLKLFKLCEKHGITADNWFNHFKLLPRPNYVNDPVILRGDAEWILTKKGRIKTKAAIAVSLSDPHLIREGIKTNELNSYFAKQDIQPADCLEGFRRIYSRGDDPVYGWNKGGRLYAIGGGYQQESQEERLTMTINGEPVTEIDIHASHLTILHGLRGWPVPAGDLYEGTGFPRFIAKSWVAMALGHNNLPTNKWSPTAKKAYVKKACGIRERGGAFASFCKTLCRARCLQKFYPMAEVGPKIAAHYPILDDWNSSSIRWGDLQFLESEVIIGAVRTLAFDYDIPALPVHDSIIVPISKREVANDVLLAVFKSYVGTSPK